MYWIWKSLIFTAVFVVVAAVAVADDDFVFAIEPKLVTMQRKLMNWWWHDERAIDVPAIVQHPPPGMNISSIVFDCELWGHESLDVRLLLLYIRRVYRQTVSNECWDAALNTNCRHHSTNSSSRCTWKKVRPAILDRSALFCKSFRINATWCNFESSFRYFIKPSNIELFFEYPVFGDIPGIPSKIEVFEYSLFEDIPSISLQEM